MLKKIFFPENSKIWSTSKDPRLAGLACCSGLFLNHLATAPVLSLNLLYQSTRLYWLHLVDQDTRYPPGKSVVPIKPHLLLVHWERGISFTSVFTSHTLSIRCHFNFHSTTYFSIFLNISIIFYFGFLFFYFMAWI